MHVLGDKTQMIPITLKRFLRAAVDEGSLRTPVKLIHSGEKHIATCAEVVIDHKLDTARCPGALALHELTTGTITLGHDVPIFLPGATQVVGGTRSTPRSEEHTSELQSRGHL